MDDNATFHSSDLPPIKLLRLCNRLNHYNSVDALFADVADVTRTMLSVSFVLVLETDEQIRPIHIAAASAEDHDLANRLKAIPVDTAIDIPKAMSCIDRPSVSHEDDILLELIAKAAAPNQFTSCCCLDMPICIRGAPVALLRAVNIKDNNFSPSDLEWVQSIAGLTATAMEAIRLRPYSHQCQFPIESFTAAKDRVIHQLSHALKTPIAILAASLRLLEKRLITLPDNDWQPVFQRAQRNLNRLLAVEYDMEDILRQQEIEMETIENDSDHHTRQFGIEGGHE